MARIIAGGLLVLAVAGSAAAAVVPCIGGGTPGVGHLRAAIYAAGSLVCHQRPERSFASCRRQWPICGRCAGLYMGAAAGALAALAGAGAAGSWRQWRARVGAGAAPTAALWAVEALGLVDPGTPLRFVVAAFAGLPVGLWLAAIARGDLR